VFHTISITTTIIIIVIIIIIIIIVMIRGVACRTRRRLTMVTDCFTSFTGTRVAHQTTSSSMPWANGG